MIPAKLQIYTHLRQDMNLAKQCLKYNLPHIINYIPELVLEIIVTHSLHGYVYYLKIISFRYT